MQNPDAKPRILPIAALGGQLVFQSFCDFICHIQPHSGGLVSAVVVVAACVALFEDTAQVALLYALPIILYIKPQV